MNDLAILGLLMESELHGYELKKRLRDVLGARLSISFGSLYPALGRLEHDGAVKAVEAETFTTLRMPMTGSFTGEAAAFRASRRRSVRGPRNKKVYGITDFGQAKLVELIADPADDERSFPLKLAFCRHTDPATRMALLMRRRITLTDRQAEGRQALRAKGERIDRYLRSLMEHDTESTAHDIAWIDRLISAEQVADEPASAPPPRGQLHESK